MPLSDVWLDISSYIKVYTSINFDEVPSSPGVYAWYYPIKLPSKNIEDLGVELSSILNYDSELKSEKIKKGNIKFNWTDIEVRISEEQKYKLAISLNASNNNVRDELIPINKKWPTGQFL